MSNTEQRSAERRHARHRTWLISTAAAIAVVGASVAVVTAAATGGPSDSTSGGRTGEINAMGMPILQTPGTSTGSVTTGAITATPSTWALGHVPLNVAVRPTWQLSNTGTDPITIGQPHAQINEGCCPGAFTLQGPNTIDPGATTDLSFELSMHPVMEGPHYLSIHVPFQNADSSTETLDLEVTGDFHD